jgi:cysteine desulfurase
MLRKVYCDHAATTPVHPEVAKVVYESLLQNWGNPSSIHAWGRQARKALEAARDQVAALIGARSSEIFFTSGGTEADNWALRGVLYANRDRGNHMVISPFEHKAVLGMAEALTKEGFELSFVDVEPETGIVTPEALAKVIRPDTLLVSIMMVNNEVGTIQDLQALVEAARAVNPKVIFHTDAVQAAGSVPIDVKALGVDLLTISSHKIYGPKGVGALFVKKSGFKFGTLIQGGSQERKMRTGTENLPGIIGFGAAAQIAKEQLEERIGHMRALRDEFLAGVLAIEGVRLNGPDPHTNPERRHPGNANISVERIEGESMLLKLDMAGIAASSGSACSSGAISPSHVLLACGYNPERAAASLRFSFGAANTAEDIPYVVEQVKASIQFLRSLVPGA